ncbi:hypothetical protein TNCV_813281 [Trichonephila clavipes]|nr:hypothetical protein TNCV_813281 [Trichonephila clavipes]
MVDVVDVGNASRRQRPLAHGGCPTLEAGFGKTPYFAHVHDDGKPVPIELSIATIPRDSSDPKVVCITVNHAGQTSKPKDFRSNFQENVRLCLVHHPLPKSVPVEYLPFCMRGKFSQLTRGNRV